MARWSRADQAGAVVEPVLFGPYRLDELIGRGEMSEVYRAFDTKRDQVVALKRLPVELGADAEFSAQFRRETAIAARLQSPHIVPIHDYGSIDGQLFIDMRLVIGTDLGKLLAHQGALAPTRAVGIIAQVASALDHAHTQGLTHRNIKPSNVLLTHDDFAYLTDFGVARVLTEAPALTATEATGGDLAYMAPERFLGQPGDHLADTYSLACMLYESLTGGPPFCGEGLSTLMYAHVHLAPPPASRQQPGVPAALDEVIARGMAKDPIQRFASASQLANAANNAVRTPTNVTLLNTSVPVRPPSTTDTVRWTNPPQTTPDARALTTDRPPPRSPSTVPAGSPPPRWNQPLLIAASVIIALLLGVGVTLVAIKLWASPSNLTTPTTIAPSQVYQAPVPDPATALYEQANTDRATLVAITDGMWVPQVSSKRVNLFADGRLYDNAAILENHQRWRSSFPAARLLWSNDWGSFHSSPNYWVTVIATAFNTPEEALQWCATQSLSCNDCIARRLTRLSTYQQITQTC